VKVDKQLVALILITLFLFAWIWWFLKKPVASRDIDSHPNEIKMLHVILPCNFSNPSGLFLLALPVGFVCAGN